MKTDIKKILSLAWPVMLGMVFQSLLATVDTYFISQLGLEQSASSGIANSISGVVFVMSTTICLCRNGSRLIWIFSYYKYFGSFF